MMVVRVGLGRVLAVVLGFFPLAVPATDFIVGWESEPWASSFCVTLVDIEGDTDLDAYVCNPDGPDRLWINNGSGMFSISSQVLDSARGYKARFGFLNGDAFPDLFLVRHLSDNRVWFNDVNGNLTDSGQSIGPNLSKRGLVLADFGEDMNGDIDAFVPTNATTQGNKVYFNDGTGTFTDSGQDLGDSFSTSAAAADLGEDMDGDIDVVVGNNAFSQVYFNNGSGTFTNSGENVGGITGTFDVGIGLLNNDSIPDIFMANGSTSGDANEVLFGDGDGTFTNSGQSLGNEYSFSLALADFDNQNGPDAFVGNNSGIMDRLWLNDGDGNFTDSGQTLGVGSAIGLEAGLINNDTHLDVYVSNRYQPDQVWLGDGAGNFSDSGQLLGSNAGTAVALADLNGDTFIDAVIGSEGGIARVLFNDGSGNFSDSNQWLSHGLGNNNSDVAIADFDGSNGPDIFIANGPQGIAGDRANRIWLNDGSGNFTDSGQTFGSENSGAVAVGNVDGDSDPDVFVGNAPYNALTGVNVLYLNSGGTLTDSGQSFGDGNSRAVELVDMDGDTDLDLFIGNLGEPNRIFLNGEGGDPLGTFSDTGQMLGSSDTWSVAFGLLDGDMHIDMIEGNDGGNKVWFGDGAGNFTDSGQSLGIRDTIEVHLIDVDDDDDLDAWFTNAANSGAPNEIWINDGDGVFTSSGLLLGDSNHQDSGIGLLDGDMLPDFFVVSQDGDHRVWLNNKTGDPRQIITPDPTAQNASLGDPVSIDVSYTTSDDDETLSGIGQRLHWDSTQLTFVNLTSIFPANLVSSDNSCQADGSDFDSDPSTDCFVEAVWDDAGGNWPGMGNTPTLLYSANFTSNVDFEQTTTVNFSASALASGYLFNSTSATVTNPDIAAPEFDSSPPAGTTLPFGNVDIMTTSAPIPVTVENLGTANLTLSCALSGSDTAEFDITACASSVIPGGSTQITVVCEPTTVGPRSASLDVTTNDDDEPLVSYPLTCTGVSEPEFDATPTPGSTLDFGSVIINFGSVTRNIDVQNLGSGDLLLSCSILGPDADQFVINACSSPVTPGGMTVLSISCEPTTIGAKTAGLRVMNNDSDESPATWPFTCEGIEDADLVLDDGFEDT